MMKQGIPYTKIALWISLILLGCWLGACRAPELNIEETHQAQDATPPSLETQPAGITPDDLNPTGTPAIADTPSTIPTNTPFPESEPTSSPRIIPIFSPGEPVTITHIEMVDAAAGWAIARDEENAVDHILITSDGANTWHDVTPAESLLQEMNEFTYRHAYGFFLDEQNASLIYDPERYGDPARIWSTSTAGNQWEVVTIETSFQVIDELTFSDPSHGWLMLGVDAGMGHAWIELYRMNANADQWELILDPFSESSADLHYCCKNKMVFYGPDTGLVTFGRGPMGGAFTNWTEDGGMTWETLPLPRPEGTFVELGDSDYGLLCESHSPALFSPQFARVALECWTDLDASDMVSFIFTTQDRGAHWTWQTYPGGQVLFLDPEVGWAFSQDIYQTLDGGQTWAKLSSVPWEGQFSFVNPKLGWAVTQDEEEITLVQTKDGGKTWDLIQPVVVE